MNHKNLKSILFGTAILTSTLLNQNCVNNKEFKAEYIDNISGLKAGHLYQSNNQVGPEFFTEFPKNLAEYLRKKGQYKIKTYTHSNKEQTICDQFSVKDLEISPELKKVNITLNENCIYNPYVLSSLTIENEDSLYLIFRPENAWKFNNGKSSKLYIDDNAMLDWPNNYNDLTDPYSKKNFEKRAFHILSLLESKVTKLD